MNKKLISGTLIASSIFFLFLNNASSQEKTEDSYTRLSQSFDTFNQNVNHRSDDLLFRFFQFRGRYGGSYQYTDIKQDGNSFTVRVTPFAYQNGRKATLSAGNIDNLKQKLLDFSFSQVGKEIEPKDDELYSAFVFQNKGNFVRLNFSGHIPSEIQAILDLLNVEFEKADKKYSEEINAKEKLVREKYGDWENNPKNVRYSTSGSRSLKNKNTSLLYLKGKQQPVTENSQEIPLYYALVLYANGKIVGGAGGGTWSFEPISRDGISWAITDGSYKPEKQLVIEYNVIDGTISIENKVYELKRGKLFIIKFDENWKLDVKQLNDFLQEPINDQTILYAFEKELDEKLLFSQ